MAEYSAQRVRQKTRSAVRRREDQIEQEEMESGELNLIPYLDMVTNLMLFILASVSAGLILSQINTSLPDKQKAPQAPITSPSTNPDDQPLGLYISIQRNEMILWSVSKLEGTLKAPNPGNVFPRLTNTVNQACDGPYMCESNQCKEGRCFVDPENPQEPQPVYPYRKLNEKLQEIATRRYTTNGVPNKLRKIETYTMVLQADGSIPYSVIVSVMAAMRCKLPEFGKEAANCRMPNENPEFKKSANPLSEDGKYFDTARAPYDPKTMALFPSIQFSSGFE